MPMVFLALTLGYVCLIEYFFRRWYMSEAPPEIPRDYPFPMIMHVIACIPAVLLSWATCYVIVSL